MSDNRAWADRPIAIRVDHVSKEYRLGRLGGGTLQHDLQSWWARRRGREDPNLPIGQEARVRGERFLALRDVSLTVHKGEAMGIIGRNGAGKSTLLKLISRITAPTAGDIDLYGRVSSMLEVGTGFNGELTGRENVYMNGAILGMRQEEIDRKLDDIIAFSEVGPYIDTPVKRYSSGMYVKLAFSVAAHLDSEIMIMDEVLAVGDVLFQKKSLQRMKHASESGRTILYVSHNLESIRRLCDRCAVLEEGRLVFVGDPEAAIRMYLNRILVSDARRDLYDLPRNPRLTRRKMQLMTAEYVGRDAIQFAQGDRPVMRLVWRNHEDYRKLCLRIEVWSLDDHVKGSYVLYDLCDGRAGQCGEATVELDVEPFAPGIYKMKYTFFFRESDGTLRDTDRVIGLFFERTGAPGEDSGYWDTAHWGTMRLTGARVLNAGEVRP